MSHFQHEAMPLDPELIDEGYTTFSSPHLIPSSLEAHSLHPSSSTSLESLTPHLPPAPGAPLTSEQGRLLLIRVSKLEEEQQRQKNTLNDVTKKHSYDADDEEDESGHPRRKRKRKRKAKESEARFITEKNRELTDEEKRAKKDLLSYLEKGLKRLAGLRDGEEILPSDAEPGESDGQIVPDFKEDVRYATNKRLISQAAYIVYKEQTSTNTCSLTHKDVHFSVKDVEELAKDAFRAWKRRHEAEVVPEKKRKKLETNKKGMRDQRRREKNKDRMRAAGKYALLHDDVDVTPLLLTDWVSEYLSDRSELEDEGQIVEYRNRKLAHAGYSLGSNDAEVWEIIRPGFRSAEINRIYAELDAITAHDRKGNKKAKRAIPRVDLGACNNGIPRSAPYPFMVDRTWKIIHVEAKNREDDFEVLSEDPEGFGANKK